MAPTQIVTAMILAAGFGKRMRPLTNERPKPMLELDGQPMIDHVLNRLALAGIERTIVNLHYHGDVLEKHLAQRRQKPAILFSNERDQILDTGGGIKRALPLIGEEPFLLHNSDSVWIETRANNLATLLTHYDPSTMDALLLMAPIKTSLGYDGAGDFFIEDRGRLRRRDPDEVSPNVFTGVSILHPRLFNDSPAGPFSINLLWDRAIAQGRVYGIPFDGQWMHVGTPQALSDAQEVLQNARS